MVRAGFAAPDPAQSPETVFHHCLQLAAVNKPQAAVDAAAAFLTNPAAQIALAQPHDGTDEPWELFFYSHYYWWLFQAAGPRGTLAPVHTNAIEAMLSRHAEAARGKRWFGYKCLINRLAHVAPKDASVQRANIERILDYDPADAFFLTFYFHWSLPDMTNTRPRIAAYYSAGGAPFPDLLLYQARQASHTDGDAFPFAMRFLAQYPTARFEQVREAVELARAALDAADTRQVRSYYTTIVTAGLKQPNDAAALPTLAYLINEKKRLEAVLPELCAVSPEQGNTE
jgi:hypothetical protein